MAKSTRKQPRHISPSPPLSQMPLSQMPLSQMPLSQMPLSQMPLSQMPLSQMLTQQALQPLSQPLSQHILEEILLVPEKAKSQNAMAFFDAESASAFQRPWLRLERGLRLQKLRQFSEEYPGLSTEEKDTLLKALVKANDAKQLNTKQQILYEGEKILSIRGLKMTRIGDEPATFKIEAGSARPTKKVKQSAS